MVERRRYRNPPIEEALCEFRFEPSQEWDLTLPGKLHEKLRDEYCGKPREQRVVEANLEIRGDNRPPNLDLSQHLAKVQFLTEVGDRLVGVGPEVLSVHMLRPYQDPSQEEEGGWREFEPRIHRALSAYWEVAQPNGVSRIGVRYINKIVVPDLSEMSDYLKTALPVVEGLSGAVRSVFSRVEYLHGDGVRIALVQGSVEAGPGRVGLMLDLDVTWESQNPVGQEEALNRARALRVREREAFEAAITERARRLFDGG